MSSILLTNLLLNLLLKLKHIFVVIKIDCDRKEIRIKKRLIFYYFVFNHKYDIKKKDENYKT